MPGLPQPAQFRRWKNGLCSTLVSASGRTDSKALTWAREVELEGKTVQDFRDSGRRFARLDRKLANALMAIASGELGRRMTQASDDALKEGRVINGRELLFLIVRYFSTGRHAEIVFTLMDLQRVTLKGDNIEAFQSAWTEVLGSLKREPDVEVLEHFYKEQVLKFKPLQEDIAHYMRLDDDDPRRSYEYLFGCVERHIKRSRQQKVRDQLSKGIAPNSSGPAMSAFKGAKSWGKVGQPAQRRRGPEGARER